MNDTQIRERQKQLDQLMLTQQQRAEAIELLKSFNLRTADAKKLLSLIIECQDNAEDAGIEEGEYRAEDAYQEGFNEMKRRVTNFAHRQVRAINYLTRKGKRKPVGARVAADFLAFLKEEEV